MKTRVLVDARMIGPKGHGIGLFVEEMAQALASSVLRPEIEFLISESCPASSAVRAFSCIETNIKFLSIEETWKIPQIISSRACQLYFSPSFSSLLYYPCPHILGLHDLNHLQFGNAFQKFYYYFLVKRAAHSAKAIFTVSETAKEEIIDWLGPSDKISVIPNACSINDFTPSPSALAKFNLKANDYLVCFATEKKHKNLEIILRAHGSLPLDKKKKLVLTCDIKLQDSSIVNFPSISYQDLLNILAHADAALVPSLYEGFSRVPIEANLLGIPAIVSDIRVHREILGDTKGNFFLDPQNPDSWAREMKNNHDKVSNKDLIRSRYSLTVVQKKLEELIFSQLR